MKKIFQKSAIVFLLLVSILFAYACFKSMQYTKETVQLTLGTNK